MRMFLTAIVAAFLLSPLAKADGDLGLGQLLKPVRVVVYEIPSGEGRAEVVRGLGAVLQRSSPNAEFVDGAAMDDAALREKIKGPFVLITVLSEKSRLLRLATQTLPLRIEHGTMRWGEFTSPVKDLLMAFLGKNPYASGYAVVFAAGSISRLTALFGGGGLDVNTGPVMLYQGTAPRP
jgi:hypothetical protein